MVINESRIKSLILEAVEEATNILYYEIEKHGGLKERTIECVINRNALGFNKYEVTKDEKEKLIKEKKLNDVILTIHKDDIMDLAGVDNYNKKADAYNNLINHNNGKRPKIKAYDIQELECILLDHLNSTSDSKSDRLFSDYVPASKKYKVYLFECNDGTILYAKHSDEPANIPDKESEPGSLYDEIEKHDGINREEMDYIIKNSIGMPDMDDVDSVILTTDDYDDDMAAFVNKNNLCVIPCNDGKYLICGTEEY